MFVPGDVVDSPLLQKRTASYAVQSLVMGVPAGGKVYNGARYSVDIPKKEDNKNRGIPVDSISTRKMEQREVTESFDSQGVGCDPMHLLYMVDFQRNSTEIVDLNSGDVIATVDAISSETTSHYFGTLSAHQFDVTLTLQTTLFSF